MKSPYIIFLFISLAIITVSCKGFWDDLGYAFSSKSKRPTGTEEMPSRNIGSASGGSGGGGGGAPAAPPVETPSSTIFLDNGKIKVGINLDYGGSVTYLSQSGSKENIVNNYDLGRQIQYSFYGWPIPYLPPGATSHPAWKDFMGWDPIQTGDVYGYGTKTYDFKRNGPNSVSFKGIPKDWALKNHPCECHVESTVELDGIALVLSHTLYNKRTDAFPLQARSQPYAGVIVNAPFHKVVTYTGNQPYTNGSLTQFNLPGSKGAGESVFTYSTERWLALVNDQNLAIGVWAPNTYLMNSRYDGTLTMKGNEYDYNSITVASDNPELLDRNIVLPFEQRVILGTVDQVRSYVYSLGRAATKPDFNFTKDRESWFYYEPGNIDTGLPFDGEWKIQIPIAGTSILSPYGFYDTNAFSKIYVQMGNFGQAKKGRLDWEYVDGSGGGSSLFDVISDGNYHTYEIDLSKNSDWKGTVKRFTLRPSIDAGGTNQWAKIKTFSWAKP